MAHKPIVLPFPQAQFHSPGDFTATIAGSHSLTLSGLPATLSITETAQIVYVKVIEAGGTGGAIYENGSGSCAFTYSGGTLTVKGVAASTLFADGDSIEVGINGKSITSDINVDTTSVDTSGLVGKPSGGDFTTAYLAATQIRCTGLPATYHPNLIAEDIVTIVQIDNTGSVVATYSRDDLPMSVAANDITVTGASFAATDTFVIYTNIERYFDSVNLEMVDGQNVDVGAGNAGLGTQRVSVSTDDVNLSAIKDAAEVMEDWDESDRAKVNPIVGEAGISANAGAMDVTTTRVTVATDDTHMGAVGAASDVDGVIHGQLRYIGEQVNTNLSIPEAEFKSPTDFTATYTSNVTITLAGSPITPTTEQIVYVKQVDDTNNTSAVWINGVNCTLEYAANVITITPDDGSTPFTSDDAYEVGINDQRKAYDSSIDSMKTTEQSPAKDWYADKVTLVTDSDIGAVDDTWVDQGAEIDARECNQVAFFVTYTANDSTGPLLQILCKDESGGTVEYDLENTADYQKTPTDGMTVVYLFKTYNSIPFLQVQTKAVDVDTGGGTEGTVTITYTKSW